MKLPAQAAVFLTGAGGGLGREFALQLAARGARLFLSDVHEARLNETAELAKRAGATAVETRPCDVTKAEEVELLAQEMERAFGRIDLVINNAGVAGAGPVGAMALTDWRWVMEINFWGVLNGCHVFVPRLKRQGFGAVLNVASCAAFATLPEMGAYNASKAAVVALTETLNGELGGTPITVSALCPTFFPTNLMESFRSPESKQRKLAEAFFRKSHMGAADVAKAALAGIERNRLIVIPQWDGKFTGLMKRFLPRLYLWSLRWGHARGMAERMLGVR